MPQYKIERGSDAGRQDKRGGSRAMRVIVCADPLHASRPDPAYAPEVAAAAVAGLEHGLINFETLVYEQDGERAVRRVATSAAGEPGVYRGWILRPADYARLYEALARRGLWLINNPDAYAHCHDLPAAYPLIETVTPRTVWLPAEGACDASRVMAALCPFG